MIRTEKNKRALSGASKNADKAFAAISDPELANVPLEERHAWAMAALLHCDICRLVVAFDECEPGMSTLQAMADLVSKLYEMNKWYSRAGAKNLIQIACNKECGPIVITDRLKELRTLYPISAIESYSSYRNKIGFHYDADTLEYLSKFANEDAAKFTELLMTFAQYSGGWAALTKAVIQNEHPKALKKN